MEFSTLIGKTLTEIENSDDEIIFYTTGGEVFRLYHAQSCCENVTVEDICGDLIDLIGTPLTMAEEVTSKENPEGVEKGYRYSFTWTFYKMATVKGSVTIRWYGESNGCYSESVDFAKVR